MSSDNSINNDADLSGALSSLNIGDDDESNTNEEKNVVNDTDNIRAITKCANCGKEGGESMNTCNKCDLVKYCNAACKKKHKSKHRKKCEKRAVELFDEKLFQEPPPREECPICMLPPPLYDNDTGMTFHTCCGKNVCDGCIYAMAGSGAKDLCPFCRTPPARSDEESIKRVKKRTGAGNADAFYVIAGNYSRGINGCPQDSAKANELFLKAGELGSANGYYNFGVAYDNGTGGVEVDKKKAKYYYELAAMMGDVHARNNLGCLEGKAGNHQRAKKHLLISAKAGYTKSLDCVKDGYIHGHVTKEEYANTLRGYQKSQDETKSEARDKARAFYEMIG